MLRHGRARHALGAPAGGAPRGSARRAVAGREAGPVPITMLDAVTVPSLLSVPCTAMKLPTLRADALAPDDVPPGPESVLKVVAEE